MLVPPFENSDEFNHAKRAEQVAAGRLIATRYGGAGTSGGVTDTGIDRVDALVGTVRFHPERKVTGDVLRQAGAIGWGSRAALTFANTAIYAPFLYVPAGIAIFAGRHTGLSIPRTLIVARAASGLLGVAASAAAIGLAGEAALFLFVLLSLPMSLSMFAAGSQDGPMLAAAALASSLLVRWPAQARPGRLAALCLAVALLALGRPAYAPLCLLPLLVPGATWRRRIAAVGASLLPVAAWSLVTARFTLINTELHRGVDPAAQLRALFHDPGRLWTLAAAIPGHQGMEGLAFYKEFIGVLGWLDVVLPAWFYGASVLALAAALAVTACGRQPPARLSVVAVALAGSVVLVFLLEYLTWTPVGRPWIEGVQGRYFVPLAAFAPLLLPALRSRTIGLLADVAAACLLAFPALSIAVAVTSVVRRYYV